MFPPSAGTRKALVGRFPSRTAIVYILLSLCALGFYSWLWPQAPVWQSDTGGYFRAARDLADFRIDRLQERAPGYPLFLVLTSLVDSRAPFIASLWLHFASVWALGYLLHRSGLGPKWLVLFAVILLLPPFVESSAYLLSENLSQFTLVVGFVSCALWIRDGHRAWAVLSAVSIACAALTRPTFQVLAIAVVAALLLMKAIAPKIPLSKSEVRKGSLILIIGSALIVGGYSLVNQRSTGYFGLSPKLGLTLTTKTARFVERLPEEHAALREVLVRYRDSELINGAGHTGLDYVWPALPELTEMTGLTYEQLSSYMLHVNLELIQNEPLSYLQEVAWAFGSYWLPASGEMASLNSRVLRLLWSLVEMAMVFGFFMNIVLLVGLLGCLYLWRVSVAELAIDGGSHSLYVEGVTYAIAGAIVAYTALVSCIVQIGIPRFRVPTDCLIVFMLFVGTHLWFQIAGLARTRGLVSEAQM